MGRAWLLPVLGFVAAGSCYGGVIAAAAHDVGTFTTRTAIGVGTAVSDTVQDAGTWASRAARNTKYAVKDAYVDVKNLGKSTPLTDAARYGRRTYFKASDTVQDGLTSGSRAVRDGARTVAYGLEDGYDAAGRFVGKGAKAVSKGVGNAYDATAKMAKSVGSKASSLVKPSTAFKAGAAYGSARTTVKSTFRKVLPSSRSVRRAAGSLGANVATAVAVTAGVSVYNSMTTGGTLSDGLESAVTQVCTPEFLVGDIVGGTVGAALGAAIPIPCALASSGVVGAMVGRLPVMAGAMIMANALRATVGMVREGNFTFRGLFAQMALPRMCGEIVGATIGSTLGALVPVPFLGQVVGGMVGAMVGGKVAAWLTGTTEEPPVVEPVPGQGDVSAGGTPVATAVVETASLVLGPPTAAELDAAYAEYKAAYQAFVQCACEGVLKRRALAAVQAANARYLALLHRLGQAAPSAQ